MLNWEFHYHYPLPTWKTTVSTNWQGSDNGCPDMEEICNYTNKNKIPNYHRVQSLNPNYYNIIHSASDNVNVKSNWKQTKQASKEETTDVLGAWQPSFPVAVWRSCPGGCDQSLLLLGLLLPPPSVLTLTVPHWGTHRGKDAEKNTFPDFICI